MDKKKVRCSFEVGPSWRIVSDELGVSIQERRFSEKKQEEVIGRIYHYPDFTTALQALVDRSAQVCGTFERIVSRINSLKKEIQETFQEVDEWRKLMLCEDTTKVKKRMEKLSSPKSRIVKRRNK